MYDRRLDAIMVAAETGSFSQAAARLRISTPALIKQVSGFEKEFGVELFERTHAGVTPTAAGSVLIEEARGIVRASKKALARARDVAESANAVRLGISMMCPGRNTLALWPRVHELAPDLRLEIIPIDDLYDDRTSQILRLGQRVDVIQSSFSTPRWDGACKLLHLLDVPFYVDVPATHPLAGRDRLTIPDLEGMRLRVFRHGNDAIDALRERLVELEGVDVIDVDHFDFALFNEAAETGDAVLTCGAWSGVHPGFTGVRLACGFGVPTYLAYAHDAPPQVARFVETLKGLLPA